MFTFSTDGPSHSLGSTLHSLVVHAVLIGGAVWGSQTVIDSTDRPEIPIDLHWPVTSTSRPVVPSGGVTLPGAPVFAPTELPPIDDLPPLDPTKPVQFTDPFLGGDTVRACAASCDPLPPITSATILTEREVDETPELRAAGALRYPTVLAQAGLEGAVVLSFVIDRGGRVETDGVEVISASHPGFIPAAKEAVLTSRFSPARKHHEPVRVRVRQTVTFKR